MEKHLCTYFLLLFILDFSVSNLSCEFQGQQLVGNNQDSRIEVCSGVHWYWNDTRSCSSPMLKLRGLKEASHQPAQSQDWVPAILRNTHWKGYLCKEMIYKLKLWDFQDHSLCQVV